MSIPSLEIINSVSTLITVTVALLSLCWSIYATRLLLQKNSDKLVLKIMPKASIMKGLEKINNEVSVNLFINFISPSRRETNVISLSYGVHKNKINYYLNKIPFIGRCFKPRLLMPAAMFGYQDLFYNGSRNLKDGTTLCHATPNSDLIKNSKLERKNMLTFFISTDIGISNNISISAKDIWV